VLYVIIRTIAPGKVRLGATGATGAMGATGAAHV
jgi:hypothetical protein